MTIDSHAELYGDELDCPHVKAMPRAFKVWFRAMRSHPYYGRFMDAPLQSNGAATIYLAYCRGYREAAKAARRKEKK